MNILYSVNKYEYINAYISSKSCLEKILSQSRKCSVHNYSYKNEDTADQRDLTLQIPKRSGVRTFYFFIFLTVFGTTYYAPSSKRHDQSMFKIHEIH